jgi:iron-sulfur cluster assembly protein
MSIELTENAARRIDKQIAGRGRGLGLRLGIKKSGCSGYAYTMDYADEISPGDRVFESHGARLVVAEKDLPLLAGLTVDFQKQGLNEAFSFINPNAKALCGCGESFTV